MTETSASGNALVRVMGRWTLAALTVNCIIGSGVFGLPSVIAGLLGRASVTAVLVAGAAMGIVMACFAEVASQFTGTGGPYLYVRTAFGRLMGIEVAWLVWFVRLTGCAANLNLFATYLGEFWPSASQPFPRFLVLTLLVGVLAAINYRGVKIGARVSNIFTAAKLLTLGAVCAAGIWYLFVTHHLALPAQPAGIHSAPAGSWVSAIVLLIFAYGGFEAALISTGEVRDPRRDTVFGLFTALIVCTVIYALIQWVVVAILPDPAHSARPLSDVGRIVMGQRGAALVAIGALFSIYGYLSGNILGTPRMTFALAERGDFPSWFAALHPRFRTPYVSIFVFALLVWLLALFGSFAGNATLSVGARLFFYGLVCAALPALRRKRPAEARFRLPAGNFFAACGVLMCVALVTRVDFRKSLMLVAILVAAFVNWAVAARRGAVD